jgi:hypothetical protein
VYHHQYGQHETGFGIGVNHQKSSLLCLEAFGRSHKWGWGGS